MFEKIDHIEIIPKNIDQSIKFYTEILSFKVKSRNKVSSSPIKEIAFLGLGDTVIEFLSVDGYKEINPGEWNLGYRCVAIKVDNMERTIKYLKSKNIAITWGPVDLGNSIRAEIKDIDGLPIELREWKK